MYRVLLVDDESIIIQGLSRIVPWEKYDCEVVGTASDGEEGIKKIKELRPHILFADIHMPGVDGLTMIAGVKSELPDLQIVVLTGYRDFVYAQQAITLGVSRFLLKPSKMEEIEEALSCIVAKLGVFDPIKTKQEDEKPEESDAAGSFIVRQAIAYIEDNCDQKFTLAEVADHCYISQWHLSKLLSKYAQKSFYDILNSARIERAKHLMQDPALRISEISEKVGYVDTAHFSRVFKKWEGISANEYRNQKSCVDRD